MKKQFLFKNKKQTGKSGRKRAEAESLWCVGGRFLVLKSSIGTGKGLMVD